MASPKPLLAPRLAPGTRIRLIAPAGPVRDEARLERGIERLRRYGFEISEGASVRRKWGYLAGTPAERLRDLQRAISDPRVDAIMCVRGGYGCMHLLESVDWSPLRRQPKVFIGFSDVTALNLAIERTVGLVCFNGPMAVSAFGLLKPRRFTMQGFERTLMRTGPAGSIWTGMRTRKFRVIRPGRASGRLTGGNLSLVAATIGTPWEIQTKGRLVFLEEVDEQAYRMDRMVTQLLLAGKLRDAAGIIIGRNVPHAEEAALERAACRRGLSQTVKPLAANCPPDAMPTIDEMLAERLRPLGIPVAVGLPFGHVDDYATMPHGVRATFDAGSGDLTLDEPAVGA